MNERIEATVDGLVQGVGFRWFVSRTAARLDLRGWVANRPDGSVAVVAEGPEAAIASFLAALQTGPSGAQVSHLEVLRGPATGRYQTFEIRAGAHTGD